MADRQKNVANAIALTSDAIDQLCEVEALRAVPYLRQAVALLKGEGTTEASSRNEELRALLRTILITLDSLGERQAGKDVQEALYKLGEPLVPLSELEGAAMMDWIRSNRLASSTN
ncbi:MULTISPECIES: hypothetical protein [unclassified Sphingomonas]|uniref:hypothetical protein n=1 Tax=unclassified Sphingomonas TaxID=196159 RepID=UPI0006F9F1B5|nr:MULTISPECIES: hypothetical protein [unclassified Sphingomonas]KQX24126.1 hypothetical protein ASD17_24500 [Sphingomonas sp. Root1294]KQY69699.1 hypothetical protein ASD39_25535 [Sphingomonas sp. Root50]KRB92932.1 hypothetical protein ASE22_25890 [Sphingomonas sp. Root720]